MRKNAILKHAIATALVGSGGLFSASAWGAFCYTSSGGNWNNSAIWNCSGSQVVPTTADTVFPYGSVSLNGANAQASNLYFCGGSLSDTGGVA